MKGRCVTMKDRLIIVAFYSPQGDDPWLNRLVATVDGPSCHVELAFPEGLFTESKNQHTMDAVCVYQGGNVEIVKKTIFQRLLQIVLRSCDLYTMDLDA